MAVQRKKSAADIIRQMNRIADMAKDKNNPRVMRASDATDKYISNISKRKTFGIDNKGWNKKFARSTYMGLSKG